ncbi:MAG TPA: hypothetical protein VNH46_13630 [Gemmatimonadales bacterium]|nr:hypothetical protein [Gemmatimonadales bacterium]
MAKRSGKAKRGAARRKTPAGKELKDLRPPEEGKKVKGGLVCIPVISIVITPYPFPGQPVPKPPVKK